MPHNFSYSETEPGEPSMKKKDIIIRDIIPLRGPNIWTYRPVLEAWVDIGELEDFPSNTIPGFYERLTALAALAGRAPLQLRGTRRLPAPRRGRHLGRPTSSNM